MAYYLHNPDDLRGNTHSSSPYEHFSKHNTQKKAPGPEYYSSLSTRTLEPITTGTSVIGIRCRDFVMIAADTLVSYGSMAKFRAIQRISNVGENTLIGASGEYSDFQAIQVMLDELIIRDKLHDDGSTLQPLEIHSYLTRVMYNRRNKFNPLYNQLVLAGFRNNKSFLGLVDLVGTSFQDETIATGYGAYIARPLLRSAWRDDLTQPEAVKLLEDCMRVLFYRDARAINKVYFSSSSPLLFCLFFEHKPRPSHFSVCYEFC
eukprot:TRINITY_DN1632_c0_g1_i1.p1 TRINITY_DN1632_c0_g1~~TRINITY_DN1632_c0_g1_i1.p1  ORF type:complete len:261 (+),score=27.88 TRINITY_DN1632_c0_g1_i1:80-862(+)